MVYFVKMYLHVFSILKRHGFKDAFYLFWVQFGDLFSDCRLPFWQIELFSSLIQADFCKKPLRQ